MTIDTETLKKSKKSVECLDINGKNILHLVFRFLGRKDCGKIVKTRGRR